MIPGPNYLNANISIQPNIITTTKTATSFSVKCISLNLFTNAAFSVNLLDATGSMIDHKMITLTQDQYKEWNNDDQYIINLVSSILGVSPITK
jgi:hypothetical protein